MTVSASIPVEHAEAANAALDLLGFGPQTFSVPLRTGTDAATHVGCHCWIKGDFLDALRALPFPVEITEDGGLDGEGNLIASDGPNFKAHVAARAFDDSDPANWFVDPVMTGTQRTHGGKLWVSLMDWNVYPPPIGWREIVAQGYPAWVQPVGAVDAYPLGGKVSFNGKNYESVIAANVWSPAVYPAGWKQIA